LPLLPKKRMGPNPGLSRASGAVVGVGRKAAAEPGALTLASEKRSCPCAPAYCNDATMFRTISRSSDTVQKLILGASKSLSTARTTKLGSVAAPGTPSGPKLLGAVTPATVLASGIGPMVAPVGRTVPFTRVGMPKLALSWKNGETA